MKADLALTNDPKLIGRRLWQLSYPTMLSFALQSVYDLVDMAWVGRISMEAISGVTLFSTIFMLFTVLNDVAGTSSISLISQSYGRGDEERTQRVAEQTISFKVVLALISAALLLLFLKPLLNFYTDDPLVYQAALDYGYIRIFFLPIMFSSYSVNTVFRTTGDAKTPMKIMMVATVINIILDPILIFDTVPYIGIPGVGLGVFGAGLATVIASTVSFLYGFIVLISGRRDVTISFRGLFTLDRDIDRDLLFIGLPAGLQLLIRQAFNMVLMQFVTVYGTVAIALAGIGGKLMHFALMPIFGFTMAGSTMIGHFLGKEDVEGALNVTKIASRIIVSVVSFFVVLGILFPKTLVKIFNDDPRVLSEGKYMMFFVSISMIILSFAFGKKIVFNGSGHTKPQLYSSVISRWVVQLPAMFLIVTVLKLPLRYLWVTYVLSETAELLVTQYHFKKGVWKGKRV